MQHESPLHSGQLHVTFCVPEADILAEVTRLETASPQAEQDADSLREQAEENCVLQHLQKTLYQEAVMLWREPELIELADHYQGGLQAEFLVSCLPRLGLDLEKIRVQVPPFPEPGEALLQARLHELKYQHQYQAVSRAVQPGDRVLANVYGTFRNLILPNSLQVNETIYLGWDQADLFNPDLLLGLKQGDTKSIDVVLPGDYPVLSAQGKRAQWHLHILAVEALSAHDETDDAAWLESAHLQLQAEAFGYWQKLLDQAILDQILETHAIDIPAQAVSEQLRWLWESEELPELQALGLEKESPKSWAAWQLARPLVKQAERHLQHNLLLRAWAWEHQITVTEAETMELVREMLSQTLEPETLDAEESLDDLLEDMAEDGSLQEMLTDVQAQLLLQKCQAEMREQVCFYIPAEASADPASETLFEGDYSDLLAAIQFAGKLELAEKT